MQPGEEPNWVRKNSYRLKYPRKTTKLEVSYNWNIRTDGHLRSFSNNQKKNNEKRTKEDKEIILSAYYHTIYFPTSKSNIAQVYLIWRQKQLEVDNNKLANVGKNVMKKKLQS